MKRRPSSGTWPSSQWAVLLRTAARALANIPNARNVRWAFGGGSAIALRLGHRISYDADIFLYDAQVLGYLSPRLDNFSAEFAESYSESANGLKIVTRYGDIDFVVATDVTPDAPIEERIDEGAPVPTHSNAEILAKKVKYRGFAFTHRDVFDLAVLIDRERTSVDHALACCSRAEIEQTFDICLARAPRLAAELPDYVNPTRFGERYMREAAGIVGTYIDDWKRRR
ncbi:MAG: nucleotidyl transferase AbiEii/AbiGii toxin family protein [Rhodospirillales bacterium]|nr:nucleotidyl transferase AbiEii/AbiGii toxin family protein [Rhodospirillales bacterium]